MPEPIYLKFSYCKIVKLRFKGLIHASGAIILQNIFFPNNYFSKHLQTDERITQFTQKKLKQTGRLFFQKPAREF